VGAFTGFYPAQADEFGHLDPVTRFLYAARSVILVISAQSAVMAGLLAATHRRFEWLPFVLVFLGFVVLHAISNLSNDYFGYRRGHDTADSPRRRYTLHPIASGAVTPRVRSDMAVQNESEPKAHAVADFLKTVANEAKTRVHKTSL